MQQPKTTEELILDSKTAIHAVLNAGHPLLIAFSGGKDSGLVSCLALQAAKECAAEGGCPLIVVTTGDTLVENPEIAVHYRAELAKMRLYAKKHGFEIITKVVTPNLASTWTIKVLTGRGLPSYQGQNTDCSMDMKVLPQQVYRRRLFKTLMKDCQVEPVICIGTRFDESVRRAANMVARGESAERPVRNKDGELVLSPIAHFTTDDVWEAIGLAAANGMLDSYTDFQETKRIYAHAESTSCAVVADAIGAGKKRGGCGQRTGCYVCQQAEDKSLENMVKYDPRYAYAQGLVKFNKFLRAIRYDWNRRHWLGRTIKGGYIALQPDTFHPSTLRELFRYMLQLDYDELCRARAADTKPMFQNLSLKMVVAIDALWSLNGFARPFSVWADYRDIFERGIRYDIPDIEPVPETPLPAARYLHVGNEWDGEHSPAFTGMRDAYFESMTSDSACAAELRCTDDGRQIWDLDTETAFDVDLESACMLLDFEMDSMLAKYESGFLPGGVTAAYKFYLQYGTLILSHSQVSEHDRILRRTSFKDRLGLSFEYDIEELLAKSVRFEDLPAEAKVLWSHKNVPASAATGGKATQQPVSYVPHIDRGWRQTDFFEEEKVAA